MTKQGNFTHADFRSAEEADGPCPLKRSSAGLWKAPLRNDLALPAEGPSWGQPRQPPNHKHGRLQRNCFHHPSSNGARGRIARAATTPPIRKMGPSLGANNSQWKGTSISTEPPERKKAQERITVDLQYLVESESKFRALKQLTCKTRILMKTMTGASASMIGWAVAMSTAGLDKGVPRVKGAPRVESPPRSRRNGHWKSKNRYREDEDMSLPWRRQKVDAFTRRISDFSEDKRRRMPANVKTYDGTGDPDDHLKIFESAATIENWPQPEKPSARDSRKGFLKQQVQEQYRRQSTSQSFSCSKHSYEVQRDPFGGRGNDKYTPMTMTPRLILATRRLKLPKPPPKCGTPESKRGEWILRVSRQMGPYTKNVSTLRQLMTNLVKVGQDSDHLVEKKQKEGKVKQRGGRQRKTHFRDKADTHLYDHHRPTMALSDDSGISAIRAGVQKACLGYLIESNGIKPGNEQVPIQGQQDKSLPLVKNTQKCEKKGDFRWTTEQKNAFTLLKQHIAALPRIVHRRPRGGVDLCIYRGMHGQLSAINYSGDGEEADPGVKLLLPRLRRTTHASERTDIGGIFSSKTRNQIVSSTGSEVKLPRTMDLILDGSSCVIRTNEDVVFRAQDLSSPTRLEWNSLTHCVFESQPTKTTRGIRSPTCGIYALTAQMGS
ncbi:hypothetical protein Tco_1081916 [Tanacetum coccineum]|uniref:Reverse transcriptase domain-containing protein n=1 Tax=Tanacetum coccineum TaxID=301880 RepID=A0ABQ5I025_9ASTR